jgi:pimeloyl-ACP methyl ester carboxylesterase
MRGRGSVVLTVLTVLGGGLAPVPVAAAAPARDSTVDILRRLGGRPCPDGSEFTCVHVPVPLDHAAPGGPTIDVVFAVLPASGPRRGMFVTATGGPGVSGISVADSYTSGFQAALPRRFDLVFFDQRGLALSGGVTCPEAATTYYRTDARAVTPAGERRVKAAAREFSQSCVDETPHADLLPFLGTDQAAEDLETFRHVMQDDHFWLYGESYGTQLAQTYATHHPDRLSGLVLDGTVDLTLDGPGFYVQQAQAFSDTLTGTLRTCGRDPACARDLGGDGLALYDRLAVRLGRGPVPFRFPLADGTTTTRSFTIADLETVASGQLYAEDDRMLLERALAGAAHDDLAPLARLLYPSLGLDPQTEAVVPDPTYSDAIYYGVECQDYSYFSGSPSQRADAYLRAGDAVEASVPRLASLFYGDLPCTFWPGAARQVPRPAPLRAPGVPTLVLGATADPATPVGNGIDVFRRLDDAYLVTQEGGPHVIFGRGVACPDDLVTAFLVSGQRPAHRKTTCPGVIADDYVPVAPADARRFATAEEALASAENEVYYLPEYYYWDGVEPVGTGCARGGLLRIRSASDHDAFELDHCSFSAGFAMTGRGSYDADRDRFELHVRVTGAGSCQLDYVRTGERTRVSGRCDRWPVAA